MCALDFIENYCCEDNQSFRSDSYNESFSEEEIVSEFLAYLKKKKKFSIVNWEPTKADYPSYMFLSSDKGILAYLDFLYVESDTSFSEKKIQINSNILLNKIRVAESQLDRPVFFVYFLNCIDRHGVFFETNEQIKDRWFRNSIKTGDYHPIFNEMGDYNNLISILTDLRHNNVRV